MKKKVLILSSSQFGYLTDTLKYCQYAASEFDITYTGWDYNRPKIEIPGVKVNYISRKANLVARNFRLLKAFHKEIKNNHDVIFANYKFGISIIKLLNRKASFVVDIRTLSVNTKRINRVINDLFLKLEIGAFKNISVISDGVANKLKLKDFYLLPLGGESFTDELKSFENLSFLYVGTLYNRNIIDCVKGFHLYLKKIDHKEPTPIFTIVGDSGGNELVEIKEYVNTHSLSKNIIITGAVPHDELNVFFENANVGISYIPLCSYYENQPSTKTFEYLLSGMPVIGTETYENKKVINSESGVLIKDNSESFLNSIYEMDNKKDHFNSKGLKTTYASHSWERVVNEKFVSLIKQLCQ
jgi:glycosyltransferase involved in cell wall biosynthesis